MIDQVLRQLKDDQSAALDRLCDFLRIPSISTQTEHAADCQKAAQWAAADLTSIGFDAQVVQTEGHPMVLAHFQADGPKVLFYGHYDVQPVDPLALWDHDPFDPQIANGKIKARGASDDKGQLMTFIEACRAFKAATGSLPCSITVMLEGEEESGSPSLEPFLHAYKDALTADIALVCDTGMIAASRPAITTSLRGMALEEVVVTGPSKDLHSGLFGGAAQNPIRLLSKIVAGLHDETGRITLPGFYEGVTELDAAQRQDWDALPVSQDDFLGGVGLSQLAGEQGYGLWEQVWARPTCDVNGIIGGYTQEGSKTVIPSKASAKFSFRLVGQQDPNQIIQAFRKYVQDCLPVDCSAKFISHGADPALQIDASLPAVAIAKDALTKTFGNPAVTVGCGGSIPVVASFKDILGMDSLLVGFGLDDDQIHSPNEKYDLESFQKGAEAWARILADLAA